MGTHPNLSEYRGHDVIGATVSIRNTGDGLSKAMDVDPVELELGNIVHIVLECEVEKHRYEPIKDVDEALKLVNMLKAGRATIVDGDIVAKYLDDQQKRIDEASGVLQLPVDGDDDTEDDPAPLGDALDEAVGALEDAEAADQDEE